MKKILLFLTIILLVFSVISVAAYQKFGFWGIAIVVLGSLLGLKILKILAGKALKVAFTAPFKIKGAVLKDADVEILKVEAAPKPDAPNWGEFQDEDEELDEYLKQEQEDWETRIHQKDWYFVDICVKPTEDNSSASVDCENKFTHWEPGELMLVDINELPDDIMSEEEEHDICEMHDCAIWEDGEFVVDEGMKFEGEKRIRLHVGVNPDVKELQFRYYFELFGKVEIPK